jgi:signal transduction histidine kinase
VLHRETLVVDGAPMAPDADPIPWRNGPPETRIGVPILIGTSLLGVALLGFRRRVTVTDRRSPRAPLPRGSDRTGGGSNPHAKPARDPAQAARRGAKAELRRIDDAKSDLISIVSHELRTP